MGAPLKAGTPTKEDSKPISWVSLASELQRDWAREETAADVVEIVLTEQLLKA